MCSLLFFSCQKDGGSVGANTKMSSEIKGGVDYAECALKFNVDSLFRLEKADMTYWLMSATDTVSENLFQDTMLKKGFSELHKRITLLQPNSTYGYTLRVTDGLFFDTIISGEFNTLDPTPMVSVDTAIFSAGVVTCRATAKIYDHAVSGGLYDKLQLLWGNDETEITNLITVDDSIGVDSVSIPGMWVLSFQGGVSMPGVSTLWFKATMSDSFGHLAESAPYRYTSFPISQIFSEADLSHWADQGVVTIAGKAIKGAVDTILYQRGFCYGLNENPTVEQDSISVATSAPVWGTYSCSLSNLQPNTTYYYRSFLQVQDENGAVFYSNACKTFTTTTTDPVDPVDPVDPDPDPAPVTVVAKEPFVPSGSVGGFSIPEGMHILIAAVDGEVSQITERGFVWKEKTNNSDPVTFENSVGSAVGFTTNDAPAEWSQYVSFLPMLGLNLAENEYLAIADSLNSGATYVLRAYVKCGDKTYYSDNVIEITGD